MKRQLFTKLACPLVICAWLLMVGEALAVEIRAMPQAQAQQGAVLQQWLARRPWLRVATERDCSNKAGLEAMRQEYGPGYLPYYIAGDFNRDGQEDFAVALVDTRKRSRRFAIAIFNGPLNQNRAVAPAFYTEGVDMSTGGLIFRADGRLLAGVFQTDDCVMLRPRGRSYVMVACP